MSAVTNDELQEKLKAATSTVIKPSFANIKVEPKEEEKNESRFPRNLHNACELFVMDMLESRKILMKYLKKMVIPILCQYVKNVIVHNKLIL